MTASAFDVTLTNTAHLYARAAEKERLLRFFTEALELTTREVTVAYVQAAEPMHAVAFCNGASLSIEFTGDAPPTLRPRPAKTREAGRTRPCRMRRA